MSEEEPPQLVPVTSTSSSTLTHLKLDSESEISIKNNNPGGGLSLTLLQIPCGGLLSVLGLVTENGLNSNSIGNTHNANSAPSMLNNITSSAPSILSNITSSASSLLSNSGNSTPSLFSSITSSAPSMLTNSVNSTSSLFGNITSSASSLLNNSGNSTPSLLSNITSSAPSILSNITSSATSHLTSSISSASSLLSNSGTSNQLLISNHGSRSPLLLSNNSNSGRDSNSLLISNNGSSNSNLLLISNRSNNGSNSSNSPPPSPTSSSVGQEQLVCVEISNGNGMKRSSEEEIEEEEEDEIHILGGTGGNGLEYGGGNGANNGLPGPDLPDTKEGIEELCPVCGDKVSGYHYGLLTCESCKGFFKRTVQNKKVYTCVAERSCHIDKTQRKRCPFCRFQKCLEVGMKLEAVRADRMRGGRNKFGPMYKRDRARKLQLMRQRQLAVQHSSPSTPNSRPPHPHLLDPSPLSAYSPGSYLPNGGGHLPIKQEIQIPQVSSLTSSPDSSPSPTLGMVVGGGGGNSGGGLGEGSTKLWATSSTSPSSHGNLSHSNSLGGGNGGNKNYGNYEPHQHHPTTSSPNSSSLSHASLVSVLETQSSSSTSSTSNSGGSKMPPLIRDLLTAVDDKEWQNSLYSLLQNQTYNQCEVDLFELLCKVLDQNLFAQVDWARNSVFFKDLKVDDQMKLLQHSWSDMLVLDHIHHRMHNHLPDDAPLPNGQKFDLLALALLGVTSSVERFNDISAKLEEIHFDTADYICLKFLLLLNPEVKGLQTRKHVQETHGHVQKSLLTYSIHCYPQVQEKFSKLIAIMPELRQVAGRGEEYLLYKHCNGAAPTQTLLMEMLHAKRK